MTGVQWPISFSWNSARRGLNWICKAELVWSQGFRQYAFVSFSVVASPCNTDIRRRTTVPTSALWFCRSGEYIVPSSQRCVVRTWPARWRQMAPFKVKREWCTSMKSESNERHWRRERNPFCSVAFTDAASTITMISEWSDISSGLRINYDCRDLVRSSRKDIRHRKDQNRRVERWT